MSDNVTMSLSQLRGFSIEICTLAVKKALVELGLHKATVSKAQASRICGKAQVERWIKEGLLNPVRDAPGKATWRINRLELDTVIAASNRHTWLNTDERRTV